MRRVITILAIACALPVVLPANDFDWLVREFSHESGAKPTHIPFFGVVRFAVAVAQPAGTSELSLAIFEHTGLAPRRFTELADEAVSDDGWKPMIRVRSRNCESTNIYEREESGKHVRLLIATLDNDTATFVEVRIQPDQLMKFIDEHRRTADHN